MIKEIDFKESLLNAVAMSSQDWSLNHRDAWIYGIICGWDEDSLSELAKRHRWSETTLQRLRDLRRQFVSTEVVPLT